MVKCTNLTKEDIKCIGARIAAAFLAEKGAFSVLSMSEAEKTFSLIADICYQSGHLYTTSEKQEGYCVYWTKRERPGAWTQLKMGLQMTFCLSIQSGMAFMKSQSNWIPTEKRYKDADDFVEVFLLAVRKEYQGQGHFQNMLNEAFTLAEKRNTICVLDTDAQIKAEKYCHAGMHIVDQKIQKSGITMFALER